jgi:flagellar hook-length control protein FliK
MQAASAAAALASTHGAQIVGQIASQISAKSGIGKSSFDFALDPAGLGHVDVSLKFDAQGQMSAVLSFDNPSAAAEAKSRAGDLQQALQQAGLDVSQSSLSFTSGGGQGSGGNAQTQGPSFYGSASASADLTPDITTLAASSRASVSGLDITI